MLCLFLVSFFDRLLEISPSVKNKYFTKKTQSCPGKRPKMSEENWSVTTSEMEGKLKIAGYLYLFFLKALCSVEKILSFDFLPRGM